MDITCLLVMCESYNTGGFYLKLAVRPNIPAHSLLHFILHACSGIWPWKWQACVCECLCGESESHSWNAGPLCGCLPPLCADLFLSLPKLRQTYVPTHIYSSLSPFLDNHRPSSTLKEDKSSDMPSSSHPLWFYVVIKTSYELWHRSLLWGHNQAVLSSLYLYLSSFSRVLETRLIPPGTLTFNPLTAIFTQHYSACIIGLFTNCIVLLNKHWLLYNSFTSLLFTLPLTLSSVLHRPLVYQKIYLSLPYLSCCFFL